MAEKVFKKVGGNDNLVFIRPSELAKSGQTGLILEALYLGAIPSNLDPSKDDYKFVREDGATVIINNTGSLAAKMKKVAPNTLVRVLYNGMGKIETGKMAGKNAHSFDVEVEAE